MEGAEALGTLLMTGDAAESSSPLLQPHDVEARNAVLELQLGILRPIGSSILIGRNHLAEGLKCFRGDGLRN